MIDRIENSGDDSNEMQHAAGNTWDLCALGKRALVCVALVALSMMALPSEAFGQGESPKTLAIVAVPADTAVPPAMVARFGKALPEKLATFGFDVMDQRAVDLKLAERPDLVTNCQKDVCLLTQARVLGVRRLVLPRLAPLLGGGLGLALTLFEVVPAEPPAPAKVERLAEAIEQCQPCQGETMTEAVERAAKQLQLAAKKSLAGTLAIQVTPESATVRVDGKNIPQGQREIKLEPGDHVIIAETAEGRSEKSVTLGERERVALALLIQGPEPPPSRVVGSSPLRVTKWVLASAGVAALIVGSALWAVDSKPTCDLPVGQLQCPLLRDSAGAGIALFASGAAALGTSALLFGLDYRRSKEGTQTAFLSLSGRF